MFFGFGLSRRSIFSVLRPTPQPHGGGVRQHFRCRESACRLGGNVFGGLGNRVVSEIARRETDWGPDRHLGDYIRRETGADMLLWRGSCIVHNEFKGQELAALKAEHPDAVVLVHPESPQSVIELGDVVGSTSKLLKAAVSRPEKKFIVATDLGILHEMQKQAPNKRIYRRPDGGQRRKLQKLRVLPVDGDEFAGGGIKYALTSGRNEILLDRKLGEAAKLPLQRMLDFAAGLKKKDVFNGMGPA